jgi:hypothetical protein
MTRSACTIDKATIELLGDQVDFLGKPSNPKNGAPADQVGKIQRFRVRTLDTLNMIFGIIDWPAAEAEVAFVEFIDGLDKYRRLEKAGRLMLSELNNREWVAELNVMKIGSKGYPTLHASDLSELNALCNGDFASLISDLGDAKVGPKVGFTGIQNRNATRVSASLAKNKPLAIAAAFTVTRVLAIMNDLGE